MPRIVVFDKAASPQRVKRVTGASENEGPWRASGRTDFLINPDLSAVIVNVPRKYWKHLAGEIVEYTQAEKDAQDAADVTAQDDAMRNGAKAQMLGRRSDSLYRRALVDVVRREINILRSEHGLAPRTNAEVRNAIRRRINDGSVDS